MRRVISGIGKTLVTLGILILLFVAYQLWGTGIYTARAQNQLESEFRASLDTAGTTTTTLRPSDPTPPDRATTTTLPIPAPPSPDDGDVVAHIVIPKIGVDAYVVEGTDASDLRKGPGHYLATPFPGQVGNSAIAGHRTTYGAPFGELDSLEAGDVIQVTTVQGSFEYRVYDKVAVRPSQTEVLDPDPGRVATLTLTTCHPKYSAAQRLVVKGELVNPAGATALPSSVDPDDPRIERADATHALSGQQESRLPTVISGIVLLLVGGLWWLLFHRHPRWTTWVIGAVPFAVALWFFYFFLERALPANY